MTRATGVDVLSAHAFHPVNHKSKETSMRTDREVTQREETEIKDKSAENVKGEPEVDYTGHTTREYGFMRRVTAPGSGSYTGSRDMGAVLKGMFMVIGVLLLLWLAISTLLSNSVNMTFSTVGYGMNGGGTTSSAPQAPQQNSQGVGLANSGSPSNESPQSLQGTPVSTADGAQGRVIIRTAQLSMLVEDIPAAVGLVKSAAGQQG